MAVYESLKMLFFYITFLWCFCSARDTIRQGDLIRDDRGRQTLVSAGGMFELGFFTPRGSTDGKRYVGIWYHKLSPQTVVWVANRKDPVVNSRSRGIVFGITEDGNLKMFDSTSGTAEPYWSSGLASTLSASNRTVTLLDSGNLVLTGYNDELGKITRLWESFEDPTDTFLPGMKMEYEKFTLTSWKDQADPGLGDFRFKIAEGMNQFVIMNKSLTYWKSGEPDKFFSSNKMPRVIVNVLSNFSNGPKCMNTICADSSKKVIPPLSDYSYTRLVINYTGQVVYKNWDKVLSVWTTGWSEPSDRCSVFNVCGSLGICSNDKKRLACTCLPGLKPSLPDKWNFGDYSDGCTRGTKLCSGENETFLSLKIVNVGNPDSTGLPVNNETECRKECFDNCRCQAYSFQASDQKIWQRGNYSPPTDVCWTWFENLIDLQEGNTIGGGHNLFARVALSDLKGRNPQPSKGELLRARMPLFWIVLATVISIIVLSCATISYAIWRRKMAKRGENRKLSDQRNRALCMLDTEKHIQELMDSGEFKEDDGKGVDVPFFKLESILAATDNFSDVNKLGQGGYGPVYKGKFPGGQEIAIKRLSSDSGQGLQEFKNEVVLIAKLQHRNLVRIRGYCMERDERILLYEYMPNKSLDSFIFDETKSVLLDWEMRFEIVIGVARGLLYLHQDSRLRIIHRDLKTSNILLDHGMNPKISDFGLARMVESKQTEANTSRVVGTYGYMSPEYALEGVFSVKSDVFSFGVVLLEIVSGKRSTRFVHSDPPLSLLGYVWRLWTENKVLDLMDHNFQESCKEDQFIKCVTIGLLCVQEDPSDRPNMSNIITMLDNDYVNLPSPKQPAFVLRRGSSSIASSSSKPETNIEITYTVEDGR